MMGSYAQMGLCGIVLHALMAKFCGAHVLGVFNQVYSVYIFFSQGATLAVHLSVLKHVSELSDDLHRAALCLWSACLITFMTAFVSVVMLNGFRDHIVFLLQSSDVGQGLGYVLPGLFCFAMNKTLLAYYNATRDMKRYAIFQSMRYVLLILFFILMITLGYTGIEITCIFSLTEGVLLVALFSFTLTRLLVPWSWEVISWIPVHLKFGLQAVLGNALMDVNSRVDVLMLGMFVSDRVVGVYSLAATMFDGVCQLPVVFRTILAPMMATYYQAGRKELEAFVHRGKSLFYRCMIPAGIVAIILFPSLLGLFGLQEDFWASWQIFSILMVGMMASAGFLPFQMIFNQSGHPGIHTIFLSLIFLTNVMLNFFLIRPLGVWGAAIATAASFVGHMVYLQLLSRKVLRISI